jgi:ABC-type uncharacterized transport system substrate-binding protein
MRRREFIILLCGATILWPRVGRCEQTGSVRIGILSPLSSSETTSPPFEAFRKALRDFGYQEGKDINFVYRWANGSHERLGEFAAELANAKVDVIFSAPGTPTAIAARNATVAIPIVFAGAGDVVGTKLVSSLARPAGNATGLVNQSQDIAGKQVQLLKEAIPNVSRVGVLWRPSNPSYKNLLSRFDAVVRATGVKVVLIDVESRATGGLMAYGPNIPEMYRRAAFYVHKILKGAKPSELPIEQPTRIELVINLKTAQALGLNVPLTLQVAADEVIE